MICKILHSLPSVHILPPISSFFSLYKLFPEYIRWMFLCFPLNSCKVDSTWGKTPYITELQFCQALKKWHQAKFDIYNGCPCVLGGGGWVRVNTYLDICIRENNRECVKFFSNRDTIKEVGHIGSWLRLNSRIKLHGFKSWNIPYYLLTLVSAT